MVASLADVARCGDTTDAVSYNDDMFHGFQWDRVKVTTVFLCSNFEIGKATLLFSRHGAKREHFFEVR
jgi:hypothetical protein